VDKEKASRVGCAAWFGASGAKHPEIGDAQN